MIRIGQMWPEPLAALYFSESLAGFSAYTRGFNHKNKGTLAGAAGACSAPSSYTADATCSQESVDPLGESDAIRRASTQHTEGGPMG